MHMISVEVQPVNQIDNLSELFVPVSRLQTFNLLYCYRQLTVSVVISAITVFRLVDNHMPSLLQIVH